MQYHVNGELVDETNATIDVADRGFLYGDAAFETLRAYGGQVFAWDAHHDRLQSTCAALGIDHSLDTDDLRSRVHETLAANDLRDAYVRLSITRGVQEARLTPLPEVDPTVVVIVEELPRGGVDGTPTWAAPARLETVETRRTPDDVIPAHAKTHNYLNGILARRELGANADDALLLDHDDHVTEGTTSNVFWVRDGTLHTPGPGLPVLPGITRWTVLRLAEDLDIPVEQGTYTRRNVRQADEVFLTNTTWEIRPVTEFNRTDYEVGDVTTRLASAFDELIESRFY